MRTLLLLALLSSVPLEAGYLWQRTVTLNHLKVGSSDATNFPYVICLNGATNCGSIISDFADSGHSGLIQHTVSLTYGGRTYTVPADLVVSSTTCNSPTLMNWEVGAYTNTSGSIIMYVKAPTVSHTADTLTGYLCYDNSAVSTWQGNINGTWTPYVYVNHGNDGTTAYLYDSTSTGATMTAGTGSLVTNTSSGAPPIAMGAGEGNIDNQNGIFLTSTVGTFGKTTHFTIEAWVLWFSGTGGVAAVPIGIQIGTGSSHDFYMLIDGNDGPGKFDGCVADITAGSNCVTGGTFSTGTWFHFVLTGDGTTVTFYVNGASIGTNTYSNEGSAVANSKGWATGALWFPAGPTNSNRSISRIDEWRIMNGTTAGADYVTASYNSVLNPSTFVTIGAAQTPPVGFHHKVSLN